MIFIKWETNIKPHNKFQDRKSQLRYQNKIKYINIIYLNFKKSEEYI